ncbi:MAG TPA: oligosaccharide flippase family protein, partial [Patescibacteria group bacterium]
INSVIHVVFVASIVLSLLFIGGLRIFSPKLAFLQQNIIYIISFCIFVAGASLNTIIDSTFMAYRVSENILIKNTVLSILKLVLPLFLVFFGSYGIFSSVAIATLISGIVGIIILIFNFNFSPKLTFNKEAIKEMGKFSGGNYLAGFLSSAPGLLLPILIVNGHSSETAAYYYVSSMILGFLMIISQSTTQSLLVEGSHDTSAIRQHFFKALQIIFIFLIPAILMIVLFGNFILHAFGKNYALQSFAFLRIMSISAIFMAMSSLGNSLLRLYHKIGDLIFLNGITAVITLGFSYVFIPQGLIAIGWAWLLSQIISVIIYGVFLRWKNLI